MGTKDVSITQDEPVAGDIRGIVLGLGSGAGIPEGITIFYRTRTSGGDHITNEKLEVAFADLAAPQQAELQAVVTWAVNQVVAEEGPFT